MTWHEELVAGHQESGGAAFADVFTSDIYWDISAFFRGSTAGNLEDPDAWAELTMSQESVTFEPETFVGTDGIVQMYVYDWSPYGANATNDSREPAHTIARLAPIGPNGVEAFVAAMSLDEWTVRRPGWSQDDDAERIAEDWLRVWSGATGGALSLYDTRGELHDTIASVERAGPAAIEEYAEQTAGGWVIAAVGRDDIRGIYPIVRGTDQHRPLEELVLVVEGHVADGCVGELTIWLMLHDGRIVHESRYWPVELARRCLSRGDLPEGWWDGNRSTVPTTTVAPTTTENLSTPSEPLDLGTETVTIYNGTPVLNDLLAWGIDRFEAAGLGRPVPDRATFTIQSEFCEEVQGRFRGGDDGALVEFCFTETDACWDRECTGMLPAARGVILHELAHLWIDEHERELDIERFLAHVGLEHWRSRDVPWIERGHEHAADTIAWGLMDQDIVMMRVGQPTDPHLTTGFRIITGVDPLPKPS